MESKEISFSEHIDLNAVLNGGAADAGVTYVIPYIYADIISITSDGIVTPLIEGGAIVVIVDTATGEEIDKVVLHIKPDGNDILVIGIVTIPGLQVLNLTSVTFDSIGGNTTFVFTGTRNELRTIDLEVLEMDGVTVVGFAAIGSVMPDSFSAGLAHYSMPTNTGALTVGTSYIGRVIDTTSTPIQSDLTFTA